jgi:hypothetical protein
VFVVFAAVVALACALVSARRVWLATNATAIHPDVLAEALRSLDAERRLELFRDVSVREPRADWERALASALSTDDAEIRAALVNEQLRELDYRLQRWSRVPRVCASISSSFALMLATLVLRGGLAAGADGITEQGVERLLFDALGVAALGMVGTVSSIAAQRCARAIVRARTAETDALVEILGRPS